MTREIKSMKIENGTFNLVSLSKNEVIENLKDIVNYFEETLEIFNDTTRRDTDGVLRSIKKYKEDVETLKMAIEMLSTEPCEQIKWERDTAIAQLKELGYAFGEKIDFSLSTSDNAISRTDISDFVKSHIHEIITESGADKNAHTNRVLRHIVDYIDRMPPVEPTRAKAESEGENENSNKAN